MKLSVTIILKLRFLKLSALISFCLKHSLPFCDACFPYRSSACFWKPWLISSSFTKMTCRIGFLFSWHSYWKKWEQICWGLCRQKFRKLWMSPGRVLKPAQCCHFHRVMGGHIMSVLETQCYCVFRGLNPEHQHKWEQNYVIYLKHNISSV